MYPDQNNSNCGCDTTTTPTVTAPAPPECLGGEQCVEIVNTSCVKYDGPDIPGVAANGDNMTTVLQGLSDNGNIGGGGGAANFILTPVGSNITLNGSTNPVTVDAAGQNVYIEALSTPGPMGPPGDTLSAKGTAASYAAMVAAHPSPTVLDAYVVQDTGHFWVYDPTSGAANGAGWVDMGAIAGPAGATGATGAAGPSGTSILYGGSNPVAGVGNNGDFYINTLTNTLWGPKVGGAWPVSGVSLIGPAGTAGAAGSSATVSVGTVTTAAAGTPAAVTNAGTLSAAVFNFTIPQGPAGANGAAGATGAAGTSILHGTTAPTGGNNGDFYLNTATYVLYGPKAAGVWPSTGQSLIGAAGANGAAGAAGAAGATGATGPAGQAVMIGFRTIDNTSSAALKKVQGGYTGVSGDPSDIGKFVKCTLNTGDLDFLVPNLSNASFPVGGQFVITRMTANKVRIIPESLSGVTVTSSDNMTYLRSLNSSATLIKESPTQWYLIGDLAPY
jgi:hypothetical protein